MLMKIIKICALFIVFLSVSCKKERTCECSSSKGTYDSGTLDASKSYAKKYCKDLSAGETVCKLKE
jgi:hypothetical protein